MTNIDNVWAGNLIQSKFRKPKGNQRFWSSRPRWPVAPPIEVWEATLGSPRLINLLAFKVSRFPCVVTAEWYSEEAEDWFPFEYAVNSEYTRGSLESRREVIRQPVQLGISESVPNILNERDRHRHPQHRGRNHWRKEEWKTVPVETRKVRFLIDRNTRGVQPTTRGGYAVQYSVALKDVKIGYRVSDRADVPVTARNGETIEVGQDILGSQVAYSLYQQEAERATDRSLSTSWRSEPQPFNYAVVPFLIDMRDTQGEGQVIDSLYLDPTTPGVHCNLYYTNDEPEGDFLGGSREISARFRDERLPVGAGANGEISMDTSMISGIGISSLRARLDPQQDWWVGMDLTEVAGVDDTDERPLISIGQHRLYQQEGVIHLALSDGKEFSLDLPDYHGTGTRYRLLVAHRGRTNSQQEYLSIGYRIAGLDPVWVHSAFIVPAGIGDIRIGLGPDDQNQTPAAMKIHGVVVKVERLKPDTEDWFFDEGATYISDLRGSVQGSRNTEVNALLRMHPGFVTSTNPFGVVGGDLDRLMNHAVWHPVGRDFTLHRGTMTLPPTKARYWKLEFTHLSPEIYEVFHVMRRRVLLFPRDLVEQHRKAGPQRLRSYYPHGVESMVNGRAIDIDLSYTDALDRIEEVGVGPNATKALTVRDPNLSERAAETGWIWQYQPWHMGYDSPRWTEPVQHHYEEVLVNHRTKTGFFVGLKEVIPQRTKIGAVDDTEEYVERFFDDTDIEASSGMEFSGQGVVATGSSGSLESKAMASFSDVRGIQFATMQTAPVQVLHDPDFENAELGYFYDSIGDSTGQRRDASLVEVVRGYVVRTYLDHEAKVYSQLEAETYAELEGIVDPSGISEGGLETREPYRPLGTGRLVAKALVSANKALSSPVEVEIIRALTGETLASSQQDVAPGGVTEISCGFSPGGFIETLTYSDLEAMPEIGTSLATDPREIGPGGRSNATPKKISPVEFSTTVLEAEALYQTIYYTFTPPVDGDVSFDTFLSALEDETQPASLEVYVFLEGESIGAGTSTFDGGRERRIVSVFSGEPVTVKVVFQPPYVDSEPAPFAQDVRLRLRVSAIDDEDEGTNLWAPDLTPVVANEATYETLEGYRYGELEQRDGLQSLLRMRVIQRGPNTDKFNVHRMALYEDPILWSFSVDDGATWQRALGIKDDPNGVMMFSAPGNMLRWKAETFLPHASITAMHLRPWYGGDRHHAPTFFDLEQTGPNRSGWDSFPPLAFHPMWQDKGTTERVPEVIPALEPVWRNVVPNPSAEGPTSPWTAQGGDVSLVDPSSPSEVTVATNLIPVPSFENGDPINCWVYTRCTDAEDLTWAAVGTASRRITVTDVAAGTIYFYPTSQGTAVGVDDNRIGPVAQNQYVSARVTIKALVDFRATLQINQYDAALAGLGVAGSVSVDLAAGDVAVVALPDVVASDASVASVLPQVLIREWGTDNDYPTAEDVCLIDAAVCQVTDDPITSVNYFDGDVTETSANRYEWAGTAHESTSAQIFKAQV